MSAQTFNGVTIGGTADNPTIVNNSSKPVMGYAIAQNTANDSRVIVVLDMPTLVNNTPVLPGEERPAGLPRGGFRARALNSPRGEAEQIVSHTLLAVLFADGSFIGPDDMLQRFSSKMDQWRSVARDAQYRADKYQLMEAGRKEMFERGKITPLSIMAVNLLVIRDTRGESEAEAALGRLAALPDIQRGEQQ